MAIRTRQIVNFSRANSVCEYGVIADRPLRRMRGLMGRRGLGHGEGLMLRPAPAIHTGFMRFPIDVVFLTNELEVLQVVEGLKPWRMSGNREARAVLELAAGECERRGVKPGHRFGLLEPAPDPPIPDSVLAEILLDYATQPEELEAESTTANGNSVNFSTVVGMDHDAAPNAIHVLLVASDRRFRSVASMLLARRGFAVTTSDNARGVAQLAPRDRADVVVIDAGALLTAAARTADLVGSLVPPVGVVIVADEAESGLPHMPMLPKWGPIEDLVGAIEDADRARGLRSRLVG